MYLDDIPLDHIAVIEDKTQPLVNGKPGAIVWVEKKRVSCLFWRGSISNRLISEKIKPDVSASMVCRPSDITAADIPSAARVTILDGSAVIGYFSAFYVDDIAGQGDVAMIPLKEYI